MIKKIKDQNLFRYCPVYERINGQIFCYRIFQDLNTNLFHVQSCDNVSIDEKTRLQLENQLIELFIEQLPNSREKGYKSIIKAIEVFKKDFE